MNARASTKTSQRRTGTTLRPALQALRQQTGGAAGAALADLGPGTSLPEDVRAPLEQRLGGDFSSVRVHTGEHAAVLAGAFGAKALADGDELVFAAGRFEPATAGGRELLAHELSHVLQERQGGGSAMPAEARARSAASTVAQGGSVEPQSLGGADPGVHCDPDDKKKPAGEGGTSLLPPLPNFQLSTLPPLDYLKLQGIAGAHGQRFSMRDASDMAAEWQRSAAMLRLFGLDRGIHLGPFSWTGDELLNSMLGKQYSDRLSRENPNAQDRFDMQFKQAYPDAFTIPPTLLQKTWTF